MSLKSKSLSTLLVLVVAGLTLGGWWYFSARAQEPDKGARTKPAQAVLVKSERALKSRVPEVLTVTGFVTPLETVDIRSQVLSTVQRIHVKEGQTVKAGQILFSLDDRGANADSDKLAAQVARDLVALEDAERNLARQTELRARNFVAQSVVDSARSAVDAARATLKADRAALASGRVAVDYRRIDAPIAGRVGEIKVHLGSLVQSSSDAMTTITTMDPINVTFSVPERHVAALLAGQRAGEVNVEARIKNEKLYGKLSFIDNTIDTTAGSIKARAVFANPQAVLWPGALVDVSITLQTLDGVVVPPRAIQVGPNGQFVYVVGDDDTVMAQPVKIDYLTAEQALVSGVAEGSRVVTEGGQNLRPGLKTTEAGAGGKGEKPGEGVPGKANRKAAP